MKDIPNIGQFAEATANRDAIHIAVAPVEAIEQLAPGQRVRLKDGKAELCEHKHEAVGVVDPYLDAMVNRGQRFWLFLFPGSVTSMRHEWTHRAFVANPPAGLPTPSEMWLREFAGRVGHDYERVLKAAGTALDRGGAWAGDEDDQERYNNEKVNLLIHAALVLGKTPPADPEDVYFSCAC